MKKQIIRESKEMVIAQRDRARKVIRQIQVRMAQDFKEMAASHWKPDNLDELVDLLDFEYPELK